MKYPGNENLAEEIRERIVNTFLQTLDLVEKKDIREAQLGCDFVLRLDPKFKPAKVLNDRLRDSGNAEDSSVSVEVADLRASVTPGGRPDDGQTAPGEPAADSAIFASGEPFEGSEPSSSADEEPGTLDAALDLSSLGSAATSPAPTSPTEDATEDATEDTPQEGAGGEPVAALDDESEQRVQDLLTEGQTAFEASEYQSAIDAWSRIFLIDIDHPEANRRIDLARKLKAEVERKLEETFHDAVSKVESGRLDDARQGFKTVLQIMPGHVAAQEYLARLEAPDFEPPEPAAPPSEAVSSPKLSTDDLPDPLAAAEPADDLLDAEILTPPDPADFDPAPSVGRVGRASKPTRSSSQTFKIVGAGSLALIAIVGWLLFKNWNVFFPNATDVAPTVQLDPITRAKRTHAEAGAAIAIAQLRRLSPGHPQYAEAQALVAQWEAALDASNPDKDEPEPEILANRDRWVEEAQTAAAAGEFRLAREYLNRASSHAPLDDGASELLEQTEIELDPLRTEIAMFSDGEWDLALRNLWRMWEGDSATPDVRRLMVDAYFNLGVRDLQRNDVEAAAGNFREALELAGEDDQLARLIRFAQTYEGRRDDLLYRIFVKYLPFR